MASGIAEGSALGPLQFLTYINDMDMNIGGTISLFAGDSKSIMLLIVKRVVIGYRLLTIW